MTVSGKRILLVEDDRFLRRACEAGLERQGFTLITAADGEEGLRLARTPRPDPPRHTHAENVWNRGPSCAQGR